MIELEILGSALVLGAIGAMSRKWYRTGFTCNLASAAVWSVVAVHTGLWGLLGLQGGIALLALRGLYTHRR